MYWSDGAESRLTFHLLRCECPCAACVDEFTGKRILDVDSVPLTVQPERIGFSGNYALKIVWTDGHSTGLYTFDHLRRLADGARREFQGDDE